MDEQFVDVFDNGTIRLGENVVCDGFIYGFPYRVQTHIHDDHMIKFNTSKGYQDLLMSPETRLLLIAELNEDLEFRDNLISVNYKVEHNLIDGSVLTFLRSGHMLGS